MRRKYLETLAFLGTTGVVGMMLRYRSVLDPPRQSAAAKFVIPISLVLLALAIWNRSHRGRGAGMYATALLGFVPLMVSGANQALSNSFAKRLGMSYPTPESAVVMLAPIAVLAVLAPYAIALPPKIDGVLRRMMPVLVVVELAVFVVALVRSFGRPDPDTVRVGYDGPLAAPIGWTHLAGGGVVLAIVALVVALFFDHRARDLAVVPEERERGYRVAPPRAPDEAKTAYEIDEYEGRARSARLVAFSVVALSAAPLAVAMARGLGI